MASSSISSPHIAATFVSCSSLHSNSQSYIPLRTTSTTLPSKNFIFFHNPFGKNNTLRPILLPPPAAAEDVISSAETAVEAAESVYKTTDEGVATVVSALFFFAFIGLSAITVGVVYLVVTDFLQKREKEKFEKEEATKKSKKKKKVAKVRAGPKGFGQKVFEQEDKDN